MGSKNQFLCTLKKRKLMVSSRSQNPIRFQPFDLVDYVEEKFLVLVNIFDHLQKYMDALQKKLCTSSWMVIKRVHIDQIVCWQLTE